MRLLLDTHALLWWVLDDDAIPAGIHDAIVNPANEKFVSAVSAMEIATKVRIGKLPEATALAAAFEDILADQGFHALALTIAHARHAGAMPGEHRDPFDRMLAAQAVLENLVIISADAALDRFGVQRLW